MTYSVGLQDPFDYAAKWILIGIILILAAIAIRWLLRHREAVGRTFYRISHASLFMYALLGPRKRRAMRRIRAVEKDFSAGKTDMRGAYQRMSYEVRHFVRKAADVPADHMSYEEIRKAGNPQLTALIGECYLPEFAWKSDAEAYASLDHCRDLIRTWRNPKAAKDSKSFEETERPEKFE